ncbi:MAG: coenzyme F420-0:L-glutamate ligase [bacterium]|nr:coenzyme F420-0:L-glutamate ligase [bacterium]
MTQKSLIVIPVSAPVQQTQFDLMDTLISAISAEGEQLQTGDVVAISSKYAAISQGRIVAMDAVQVTAQAEEIATRYHMNPHLTQLVIQEADHIFGGITHEFNGVQVGFLLTHKNGVISPNAGLDRSNIPSGQVVLLPSEPYALAESIRQAIYARLGVKVGVILTDSWLMPGRWGTTGVAISTAGFHPIQDERGKPDLFGNPMMVTQRGIADQICACAQMVMGETAEARPIAIVRNTGVIMTDDHIDVEDVAIPWETCIYVGSLTKGAL